MNKIKQLRIEKGLSQAKLAEKLNVHQTAVSQWEKGRTMPDIEIAQRMAELFNVTLDYLLGRETAISEQKNTEEETLIINKYNSLNAAGKQVATEYIDYLLTNPKYTSNTAEIITPHFTSHSQNEVKAAAFGGATKETFITDETNKEIEKLLEKNTTDNNKY